jgi:hypothetical protein
MRRGVEISVPGALPNLDKSQIEGLIQKVAEYIENQRQTYREKATPIDNNQKTVIAPVWPRAQRTLKGHH